MIVLRVFWRLIVTFTGYVLACIAAGLVLANDVGLVVQSWVVENGNAFGVDPALLDRAGEISRFGPQLLTAPVIFWVAFAPSAVVILLAEIFRWRSWVFYVLAAVLVAGISQPTLIAADALISAGSGVPEITYYLAAAFVSGLVYWVVAGRGAGFTRHPASEGPTLDNNGQP